MKRLLLLVFVEEQEWKWQKGRLQDLLSSWVSKQEFNQQDSPLHWEVCSCSVGVIFHPITLPASIKPFKSGSNELLHYHDERIQFWIQNFHLLATLHVALFLEHPCLC